MTGINVINVIKTKIKMTVINVINVIKTKIKKMTGINVINVIKTKIKNDWYQYDQRLFATSRTENTRKSACI